MRLRLVESQTYVAIGQVFKISLERTQQIWGRAARSILSPVNKYGLKGYEGRRRR